MAIKLYVGNLSFQTSSEDLRDLFSQAGNVETANVVEDRDTGRSRGFGFVEMSSKEEAEAAAAVMVVVAAAAVAAAASAAAAVATASRAGKGACDLYKTLREKSPGW